MILSNISYESAALGDESMHEQTIKNLMAAFAGESMARNKYDMWADKAEEEGLIRVAHFFRETARNEHYHARELLKLAQDGIGETLTNLQKAREGEEYEHTEMYPEFAKQAREVGDKKAAVLFELIAKVEQEHDARYAELLRQLEEDQLYEREEKEYWICEDCGHIHYGKKPPRNCPICKAPQGKFNLKPGY